MCDTRVTMKKSNVGALIYKLADERGIPIHELATMVPNTTPSTFSKIRSGDYSRISDERLCCIAQILAPDDKVLRAEIICAYLQDMCPGDFQHLVEIRPNVKRRLSKESNALGINAILDKLGETAARDEVFLSHLKSLEGLTESILKESSSSEKLKQAKRTAGTKKKGRVLKSRKTLKNPPIRR